MHTTNGSRCPYGHTTNKSYAYRAVTRRWITSRRIRSGVASLKLITQSPGNERAVHMTVPLGYRQEQASTTGPTENDHRKDHPHFRTDQGNSGLDVGQNLFLRGRESRYIRNAVTLSAFAATSGSGLHIARLACRLSGYRVQQLSMPWLSTPDRPRGSSSRCHLSYSATSPSSRPTWQHICGSFRPPILVTSSGAKRSRDISL